MFVLTQSDVAPVVPLDASI
jgi:hypothetical protein